jgi:hypothetical protein
MARLLTIEAECVELVPKIAKVERFTGSFQVEKPLTSGNDLHYIACSIMHELDRVRGQGNDTNGSNPNGDDTVPDAVAGTKVERAAERGGG